VLWLLRHGQAAHGVEGGDAARPLTPWGERVVGDLGATLAAEGWRPARVFVSPLRRARQTAVLLLARVAPDLALETLDELEPEAGPEGVMEALRAHDALQGHVLLIGHQPLLGMLAERLADGVEPGFSPATLIGIAFDGAPADGAGRVVTTRRPPPSP